MTRKRSPIHLLEKMNCIDELDNLGKFMSHNKNFFCRLAMSLKFGIYLVEQRIISPEQFCGLVKIQQEAAITMASIALRKNLMTIKQVTATIDASAAEPGKSFVQVAAERGLIDQQDVQLIMQEKENSSPLLRKLLVECGLLTKRQASVLYMHFEKISSTQSKQQHAAAPQQAKPKTAFAPSASAAATGVTAKDDAVRQPKFQQRRPVIVQQQPTA